MKEERRKERSKEHEVMDIKQYPSPDILIFPSNTESKRAVEKRRGRENVEKRIKIKIIK